MNIVLKNIAPTYGFTIYIFLNRISFIIYLEDSTWSIFHARMNDLFLASFAFPSKSIFPLENVKSYISYLNYNSGLRKRQSWLQPS